MRYRGQHRPVGSFDYSFLLSRFTANNSNNARVTATINIHFFYCTELPYHDALRVQTCWTCKQ